MSITDRELRFLIALAGMGARRSPKPPGPGWVTVPGLQRRAYLEPSFSPQGFHQTAASLVRKGLAAKDRAAGRVWYSLSPAGHALLRDLERRAVEARREAVRAALARRYGPAIEPTGEMVAAVTDGLDAERGAAG